MSGNRSRSRCLLWIDAVGGFLVCFNDEVVLGQATPGNIVDVPIMGDLSRRHATLQREEESYILIPMGQLSISGRQVTQPHVLSDGDEIELGPSVQLRFRQPHSLSATARLDFLSHHRTQPSADAVLLMADSCVLGPSLSSHVVCRDWSQDLILHRKGNGWACRSKQTLEVDGRRRYGTVELMRNSRVAGEDFALSLEDL